MPDYKRCIDCKTRSKAVFDLGQGFLCRACADARELEAHELLTEVKEAGPCGCCQAEPEAHCQDCLCGDCTTALPPLANPMSERLTAILAAGKRESERWLAARHCPECPKYGANYPIKLAQTQRVRGLVSDFGLECPNCERWWTTVPPFEACDRCKARPPERSEEGKRLPLCVECKSDEQRHAGKDDARCPECPVKLVATQLVPCAVECHCKNHDYAADPDGKRSWNILECPNCGWWTTGITARIDGIGRDSYVPDNPAAVDATVFAVGVEIGEVTLVPDDPCNGGELARWGDCIEHWASDDVRQYLERFSDAETDRDDVVASIEQAVREAAK